MKNNIDTPYYLIDEQKLLRNLKIILRIKESCGAKSVLALKCFSTWAVFGLMKQYMDGATASSPFEARLGREKFGKEIHAYSPAFSENDIKETARYADKIIFNSISQLETLSGRAGGAKIGLRVNPGISYSHFDLADPNRMNSRLGITDKKSLKKALPLVSGLMFHYNCENDNYNNFAYNLDSISNNYKDILPKLEWVSLGGGFYFTKPGYPVGKFCKKLKDFARRFGVQVYLEPGESAVTQAGTLVTKILDIVRNKTDIAIIDASTEAHMLDLLIYRLNAKIYGTGKGNFKYTIAGCSCLAGDIFGTYRFKHRLKTGNILNISDAAGYTMVKKNWFNGLGMPSIAVKKIDGSIKLVRGFGYRDFLNSLS